VAGATPGEKLRILDEFDIEFDVFGGEGRAVMPLHVRLELDAPLQPIGR
jgi:hypothetical protein